MLTTLGSTWRAFRAVCLLIIPFCNQDGYSHTQHHVYTLFLTWHGLFSFLQLGSKGYGDPVTFDNVYYTALLKKPWDDPSNSMASMIGLPSDHVLPDDPECRPVIEAYAASQQKFFQDFGTAYAKLTMLGAQWM